MKIGDPSSKYAYGRSLDKDIENKQEEYEKLKVDVCAYLDILINTQVVYNDGSVMTRKNKLQAIREAYIEILRQEGGIN